MGLKSSGAASATENAVRVTANADEGYVSPLNIGRPMVVRPISKLSWIMKIQIPFFTLCVIIII